MNQPERLTGLTEQLSLPIADEENYDDELRNGDTPDSVAERLGLRPIDDMPVQFTRQLPPLQPAMSLDQWIQELARLIRVWLIGYTDLELAALCPAGESPVELTQEENRQQGAELRERLTSFADRWDPGAEDDPTYLEQLERVRAEFEGTSRKGPRP